MDSENLFMRINLTVERNYNELTLQELYDLRTTFYFINDRLLEEISYVDKFISAKNEDVD